MPSEYISPAPQDSKFYEKKIYLHANSSNLSYYIKKNREGRSDKKGRHQIGSFFQKGQNGT